MVTPDEAEDSDYEVCTECKEKKRRFVDFSPRHSHCRRHKRRDHDCTACEALYNHPLRQPRCKACDRARGARKRCFDQLKRITADFPANTIEEVNSSYKAVRVHGARNLPREVVERLRDTAAPVLRLDWDFKPLPAQRDLFAHVPPEILKTPPRGSRTHAPIYDLVASAGLFGASTLPESLGFVNTFQRTREEDFVVSIAGQSMEPTLLHGARCVFRHEPAGRNHDHRIVLAQLRETGDPEYGGRYSVKRLQLDGAGRQGRITLVPDNDEYPRLSYEPDAVAIVGVYLRTLASA